MNTTATSESREPKLIWRFESFVLDERGPTLMRDAKSLECQGKPMQVLVHLLEHAGEVVTKDELIERCWPRRIPSESVLTKAMAKLREVLGDEEQRIIKTVYGYGYRFSVPVQRSPADGTHSPDRGLKAGDAPPQRPHWILREKLGGTGESWMAEHAKTGDRRVFKFGLDDMALRVIKREITLFRVLDESPQAQGTYRRLLDWNLIEPPYFIEAEYIEGGSLRQWIEARGGCKAVPLAERLRLIAQIARALDAAHQAGVLHKDLKPANVLIEVAADGRGHARLADFGSGEVMDRKRLAELGVTQLGFTQTTDSTAYTGGTPLYAAPEVVAGAMPTVQADVYALGVMLFQILAGDWRRTLSPGWEREIDDQLLREDIAAATDNMPARRLGSAGLLAERLENIEPRRAQRVREAEERAETERLRQQESRARARKPWIRAAVLLLILGSGLSMTMAWQAWQARQVADREVAMQRAVSEFLADLLTASDPLSEAGGSLDVTVREVVDRAAAQATEGFKGRPEQETAIRLLLGNVYRNSDQMEPAREQYRIGLERAHALGAAGNKLAAELQMARLESYFSVYDDEGFPAALAAVHAEPGLTETQRLTAELFDASMLDRGDLIFDRRLQRFNVLGPQLERLFGAEHELYRSYLYELAQTYFYRGEIARSVEVMRRHWALERKLLPDHPSTLNVEVTLGDALVRAGQVDEGRKLLESALARVQGRYTDESGIMGLTLQYLGYAWLASGDRARAAPLLQDGLQRIQRTRGEDNILTHEALQDLAEYWLEAGDARRALQLQQQAYDGATRLYGPLHIYTLDRVLSLARIKTDAEGSGPALAFMRPLHAQMRRLLGGEHWLTHALSAEMGRALALGGDRKEAQRLLDAARDYLSAQLPPHDPRRRRVEALAAGKPT